MTFKEITPKDLTENAVDLIGLNWMLIASGDKEKYNMMTASWGGLGVIWHKPVCFIFVRPSRYTYEFIEKNDQFSLNFFTEDYRPILNVCGSKSGRDINKMKECKLTTTAENGTIYFNEARITLVCKKLYYDDLKSDHFLHPIQDNFYKNGNFHRMYIGEILKCYVKD